VPRFSRAIWALLAVQLLFASNAVVGRLNVLYLGPQFLVLVRILGATAVFAALGRRFGAMVPRSRRDLALFALCGLLGVSLNQGLYLSGLWFSSATDASIVGTIIPVFTAGLAIAFGLERLRWAKVAGIVLALAGALYLARADTFALDRASVGDLLFVANCLSYSGYLVLSRQLVRRYNAATQIVWSFLFGAITILPFGLPGLRVLTSGPHLPGWLFFTVAYTILFPTVLAYYFSAFALQEIESSTAATYVYLQPLIAMAMAFPILGERPSARTGVAAILIFVGVLLSTRGAAQPVANSTADAAGAS
jgi:drug/metabolite transporter (DMT)-like permease